MEGATISSVPPSFGTIFPWNDPGYWLAAGEYVIEEGQPAATARPFISEFSEVGSLTTRARRTKYLSPLGSQLYYLWSVSGVFPRRSMWMARLASLSWKIRPRPMPFYEVWRCISGVWFSQLCFFLRCFSWENQNFLFTKWSKSYLLF